MTLPLRKYTRLRASATVMPAMTYLPSRGMQAIHTAANRMRRYSRSGLGSRSADRPPHTLPRAMAIMMVPMMMVHTIWLELK